ncbi:P2Y purinoceptor 1-like [Haliotis rufescens]|uniref:P2Y purinoceptor 1-like n=1 Tax=Haliotis rufescens TaxID=6454 RepID=UPI001EB054E3|nr:P2Y purinoceptor 1-like [Haliotis rufescens]XP_048240546.1 P2Y purinoceptor 1-like [Haliotis rufescens]
MTLTPESVTMDLELDNENFGYVNGNVSDGMLSFDLNSTSRRPTPRFRRIPTMDPMMATLLQFQFYGYPVILTMGTIGNVLAYVIFTRTRLKKVSSVQYLAALAITDTGFLWTSFLTPLYGYYKVPIIIQDGLCQFMTFLNYVFTFLSIWYLVALVVEKFIGVYWPMQKSTMCTPFRAKLVMSFMAVVAVACYSYVVYFFGPDKFYGILQCMPWKELRLHFENLSKIDTFVIAIIPYGVIVILTALIMIRGCEYYRISASVELFSHQNQNGRTGSQTSAHVTKIVFPVVILTVMSNLPVMILRTAMTIHGLKNPQIAKWNQVFYVVYIINFAIKFIVYITFSGSFRRRTLEVLKKGYDQMKRACRQGVAQSETDAHRINMEPMPSEKNKSGRLKKTDI